MMVCMRIVADEQIWGVPDVFEEIGDVRVLPSDAIRKTVLRDAEALIVRSVTPVDERLLDGTPVRFVGSATSGTDHVDLSWLESAGIRFADAAGCNAQPVSEYVLAALLEVAHRRSFDLASKTLGIVGVGHIGTRVAAWATALGMRVLLCDPPRDRLEGRGFVTLLDIAREAEIVTVHVPLTHKGEDRTAGMVDADWLGQLRSGLVLVNTSRGEVVDEGALAAHIDSGRCGGAVLDVWRNEPAIDPSLLDRVDIGTPHIAGYSMDASRRATRTIRDALEQWTGIEIGAGDVETDVDEDLLEIQSKLGGTQQSDIRRIVWEAFDVRAADQSFRAAIDAEPAAGFERLRRGYRGRREFRHYRVRHASPESCIHNFLSHMGFHFWECRGSRKSARGSE